MTSLNKLSASVLLAITASASANLVQAYDSGDIVVRAGATLVDPRESSDAVALNGSESVLNGVLGSSTELGVDSDTQLGLTLSYMLTPSWSLELLAATPFSHDASGKGALAGLDIAEAKQLPPTLSAVYHFDTGSALQPYIGLGLNYTAFFEEDLTSEADATFATLGLTGGSVELEDSWGLALQVGADYHINERWLLNASVRWIDIDTEAEIAFDSGDKLSADVEIDPYVYTLAIGYKF